MLVAGKVSAPVMLAVFLILGPVRGQPVYQAGWPVDHGSRQAYPALPVDLTGSGQPELVVPTHAFDLLAFGAQGQPVPGWLDPDPYVGSFIVRQGDFDGNGVRELLYLPDGAALTAAFCSLGGVPLPWPTIEPEGPFNIGTFTTLVVSDLDLDGDLEVICNGEAPGSSDDEIHVFDHQGNELPGWPKVFPDQRVKVAVEDLDGDGAKEIVLGSRHSCFCGLPAPTYVYRADGTLFPGWPATPTGGWQLHLTWPVIADLDGDGTREIIGTSPQDVYMLRSDGTQFRPRQFVNGIGRQSAIADLDSDGRKEIVVPALDLVVVDYDLGVVATTPPGYGYEGFDGISIADIDGDGFAEIGAFSIWPAAVHLFDRMLNPLPGWPVLVDPSLHIQENKTLMIDLDGDNDLEYVYAKTYFTHVYDLPNPTTSAPVVLWQGWYNDVNASSSYHVREPTLGQRYVRGDSNQNGVFELGDVVFTLTALFVPGGAGITCDDALDANDDGAINLVDPFMGLHALFMGGAPPTPGCRVDVTADPLGCAEFSACP